MPPSSGGKREATMATRSACRRVLCSAVCVRVGHQTGHPRRQRWSCAWKPTSSPVHDEASRKPVSDQLRVGRYRAVSYTHCRSWPSERRQPNSRRSRPDVRRDRRIGRHGRPRNCSRSVLDAVIVSTCSCFWRPREPDMIDGVCADRDDICRGELEELCWRHCPGIGRRCRPDGPTLRDGVKSRFDLWHGEGKQIDDARRPGQRRSQTHRVGCGQSGRLR